MKARGPKPGGAATSPPKGDRGVKPPLRAPATQAVGPAFTLPGVQRKLAVGTSDSPFEREADRVADSVLAGSAAPAISALPAGGLGAAAQRMDLSPKEEETDVQPMREEEDLGPAQRMAVSDEAEEPVQAITQEAEPEQDMPVQAMTEDGEDLSAQPMTDDMEEEEPAQMQALAPEEEAETAQTKPAGTATRDHAATEAAIRNPGAGRPLPGDVRRRIEHSTGADLSDVRVHDDGTAGQAAKGIGARAFTHGRDIWLGPGETAQDTRLMAHEAAHVVQQTGPSGRHGSAPPRPSASPVGIAQRAASTPPTPTGIVTTGSGHKADFTGGTKKLEIAALSLPDKPGKASFTPPLIAKGTGRATTQRRTWFDTVKLDISRIAAALPTNKGFPINSRATPEQLIFIGKIKNQQTYVVGTREDIAKQAVLPNWRRNGKNDYFQVDHMKEMQIGGADTLNNYQLLDPETNRDSGNVLLQEIRRRIKKARNLLIKEATRTGALSATQIEALKQKPDEIRDDFDEVKFNRATARFLPIKGPKSYWSLDEIRDASHVDKIDIRDASALTLAERDRFLGNPDNLVIYHGRGAGRANGVAWGGINGPINGAQNNFIGDDIDMIDIGPYGDRPDRLVARVFRHQAKLKTQLLTIPMTRISGLDYAFRLPTDYRGVDMVEFKGYSPVKVETLGIEENGVTVRGQLLPTAKVFKRDTSIDFLYENSRATLSKTFSGGEFDFPGPVKVTGSSLTLGAGAGAGGFSVNIAGELQFEVDRVGKGVIGGKGDSSEGFSVEGSFDFDPALFKGADAKIKVGYANDTFTGEGTLSIGDGQIKGIKSAELNVTVVNDLWEARGTVEPKIPGVSQGNLSMTFNPEGGFEIAGDLVLGEGIPRLKSGRLAAKLVKKDDVYKLSGSGSAELDIPGVTAALTATYDDGKFTAEATAGYARGIASGELTVGATNLPTDPETGQAVDGPPRDEVSIYGAGLVTIRFTPWLQGTAGISIKPDGAMEVTGRVELPDSLEVFPQKKLEKELLSVGVDIPIFGVAAAGQRIGIFLNISGALSAKASVGPGKLDNVAVQVTYDPEDESSARVTGSARFAVPAEAGLRLAIQGALGAGIPIVSARAGLEIGGALGVKGEAAATAQVEWTPKDGLSLEADIGVTATPQFTFDLTGFVDVTADLILTEIELYSKRWQLASFQYGSGMQVGAALKVKVENSKVKPISMDDITLTKPDIDPVALARGLIRKVV